MAIKILYGKPEKSVSKTTLRDLKNLQVSSFTRITRGKWLENETCIIARVLVTCRLLYAQNSMKTNCFYNALLSN